MIGYPPTGELTQGTIFTCASSEDYLDDSPYGLVITARCDLAQGKAPVISYVPLVKFRAWLFRDGLRLLALRVAAEKRGQMKSALRDAGLSDTMLDTLSPQIVRDHLAEITGKSEKKAAQRYIDAEKIIDLAEEALSSKPTEKTKADLIDSQQNIYHGVLKDLLSNAIADYHFVERSEPDEECEGYVALLREIRYLPAALADELREGIDLNRFSQLCREQPRYRDKLAITGQDHYAMAVGLLRSPFIELFMQRFTNLYARIGVTDFSPDIMKSLRALAPFNVGEAR
jgi:hypothetical protein